jgi:hypothetical protein
MSAYAEVVARSRRSSARPANARSRSEAADDGADVIAALNAAGRRVAEIGA